MRKKRILLAFIETVNFIDKQQGVAPFAALAVFRPLNNETDILYTAENGRNGLKAEITEVGQQAGEGGLTDTRRAPQDHGVELSLLNRPAERLALAHQM